MVTTNSWTRRKVLQSAVMGSAAIALHAVARGAAQMTAGPIARTPLGSLRGLVNDGTLAFRGVPFAQPPVGPLRFRAPVPAKPWSGIRDAMKSAPAAMQPGRSDISEDCLYLNVFAPQGQGPFPVFVWIHGGGFTGGSPSDAIFDGAVFAKQGIVVVTVAYRLGVFGFLDWSPMLGGEYADSANNALRDLILALRWVGTNIASFGGDAKRVTIGGESAGAKLADMLMGIEEARALFSSVISESGGAERMRTQADSAEVTRVFADQLHRMDDTGDPRTASPELLLSAQRGLVAAWDGNFPLRAESVGALLPHRALEPIAHGSGRGKRLLIGTNRDESALFLGDHPAQTLTQRNLGNTRLTQFGPVLDAYRKLYPQMTPAQLNIRALTAEEYWMPSIRVADAATSGGASIWFYRLDEEAASGPYKGEAYHSFDLGFVWERLAKSEPDVAQKLSVQIHDAWAAFIKGGAPAAAGLPAWPQWNPHTRPTMILADTSHVEQQPFEAELRLWNGFAFS
jgi:para-nitrobenzyl esterase